MRGSAAALTFLTGCLLGALGVASLPSANAEHSNASTVNDRLQRLEDRAAIEELLVAYGRDLDHRDFPAYAHLFAAQGTWSGSIGTFTGPAAIQAAMEKAFKSTPGRAIPATFHLMTNFSVHVERDRASSSSKWTFFRMVDGKPVPQLAGMYDDSFVREGGQWRFLRRVASAAQPPAR